MKRKKIYLSGKITGCSNYMELFAKAEELTKAPGVKVVNPTRMWGILQPLFNRLPYPLQLILDLCVLACCDTIAFLPNWTRSKGAWVEYQYANALKLKKRFLCLE